MKNKIISKEQLIALIVSFLIHILLGVLLLLIKPPRALNFPAHTVIVMSDFLQKPKTTHQPPALSLALPKPTLPAPQLPAPTIATQPPAPAQEQIAAAFVKTKTATDANTLATGDRPLAAPHVAALPKPLEKINLNTATSMPEKREEPPQESKSIPNAEQPQKALTQDTGTQKQELSEHTLSKSPTTVMSPAEYPIKQIEKLAESSRNSAEPEHKAQSNRYAHSPVQEPKQKNISLASITRQVLARAQSQQPTSYEADRRHTSSGNGSIVDPFSIPGASIDPTTLDPITLSKLLYAQRVFCILEQAARCYNTIHDSLIYAQSDEDQQTIFNLTIQEDGSVRKAWFTPPLHVTDLENELMHIIHEAGLLPPLPKTCQSALLTIQYPMLVSSSKGFNKYHLHIGRHH